MKKINFDVPEELMDDIEEVKAVLFISKNDIGRLALKDYCTKILQGEKNAR